MRGRALLVTSLLLSALAGCDAGDRLAVGIVVDVRATGVTAVESFTLRSDDGTVTEFRVGRLDTGPNVFPATHLREHMALAQKVAVRYRDEGGERVAFRLADAP